MWNSHPYGRHLSVSFSPQYQQLPPKRSEYSPGGIICGIISGIKRARPPGGVRGPGTLTVRFRRVLVVTPRTHDDVGVGSDISPAPPSDTGFSRLKEWERPAGSWRPPWRAGERRARTPAVHPCSDAPSLHKNPDLRASILRGSKVATAQAGEVVCVRLPHFTIEIPGDFIRRRLFYGDSVVKTIHRDS